MKTYSAKAKRLAAYIQKNPDDSFSKFALALEFLKMDKLEKSRVLFEDIHRNDPEYIGVYYHLGKVYEQMGRLQDAKNIYKQGLQMAGKHGDPKTVSELREVLAEVNFELE